MNERVGGNSRYLLGLGLLIAVVGGLALAAGSASAKTTTNATAHWEITLPDSWIETKSDNGSTFSENSNGQPPIISVASQANASAKDTDAYILSGATEVCNEVKTQTSGTYATAPHTLTGLARKAAECVIDVDYTILTFSVHLRSRYVFFASDGLDRVYMLSLSDDKDHFATSEPTFNTALSSFKVTGEPALASYDSGMMLYVVVAVVVVVVVLGVVMMKRKKKGGAPPQQPPAPPA